MSTSRQLGEGIKVAIIGGGPAGLAAAIEFGRLPFVEWHLYEQKPTISEIGAGITLQRSTWSLLEKLGASKHLGPNDFFRSSDGHDYQYSVELLPCGKLHLTFDDGFTDNVDLLVGADGIRSVVRKFACPDHSVHYTGATAYRSVVKVSDVERITGISRASVFWFGTEGKWIYTAPLDNEDWEVTCRISEADDGDRSTWGKEVSVTKFIEKFEEYCEPVQKLFSLITQIKRYDYFGGTRLPSVVNHQSIALIGDASHPLSGAFGAGAAFALEDANTLARSLRWAASSTGCLKDALNLFDSVRSPYYRALYQTMDDIAASHGKTLREAASVEEEIAGRIDNVSNQERKWMYYHDVDQAFEDAVSVIENQ
ncbi:Pyridine nucleotide-disulfide oxidoreductase class-II [Fusarium acuminatum]|uniref:Pyridine nucleotide-disulfide oxidoreductase class-II n=1 Tax=Fusarium acuminatum TaxID=5515 RepID=A0ABZ2WQG8_9HYPO